MVTRCIECLADYRAGDDDLMRDVCPRCIGSLTGHAYRVS